MDFNTPTLIAASATTTVSTGNTILYSVVVSAILDGAATFQNTAGVTYFVLPANTAKNTYEFEAALGTGLKVSNAATQTLIVNTHQ